MSTVTNIILTTGLSDRRAVEAINRNYGHVVETQLVRVFSLSHMTCVGGNKELECCVHVSAVNNLNEKQLISLIEMITWSDPDEVQLFLKRQNDDKFEEVKLELV